MAAHIDETTKQINGVICDLCNKSFVDKFEYFSGHWDLVEVDRAVGKAGIKNIDRRYFDVDICMTCMEKFKHQMLEMIKKRTEKKEEKPGETEWEVKSNG